LALALLTATLVVLALLNVRQLWIYRQPTDAALWLRTTAGLEVSAVEPPASAAAHQPSTLQRGDVLVAINGAPMAAPEAVERRLYAAGIGGELNYTLVRGGRLLEVPVQVGATRPALPRYVFLEAVGLLYLAIGLFVFYRRQRAPQALLFYLFCLASFVLYCFHFTGKLNLFDRTIFWSNEAALLLAPCLLLHFALRFHVASPVRRRVSSAERMAVRLAGLVYVPGLILGLAEVAFATGALWMPVPLSTTQALLDRADYVFFAAYLIAAAMVFARRGGAVQARIMGWATTASIVPFLALYIVPMVAGADLPRFANLSVVSLAAIPLAFGYAIWRHQLLEAEMVFRRGVVYTLATVAVVAVYLGVIALAGFLIHARLPTWGWTGWLLAILVTALLFEPMKRWLQERIDRLFYRERYDYRRTLIEFGRQMNAQPELEPLVRLALERLAQTLELGHAAILVASDQGLKLAGSVPAVPANSAALDFSFLDRRFLDATGVADGHDAHGAAGERLFVESPAGAARQLQLHYFLPCQLQGRTVAVLALGKTVRGEFLSSDDVDLAETLAGYLAVAIDNARLYATLRQQAAEYQRLKDFNENIVESIQVGVIAVNLEGVVESWNTQMEALAALPRERAIGRPLAGLLGEGFARELAMATTAGGIHNVSKLRLPTTGEDRVVDMAIAPLVTARFERVGQIVLLNDVTAETEMEQRLIQADRLRSVGLLAAGVAHEVNTPLAVISSYAQMLAKQSEPGDPRLSVLNTITRQTFRASEIIANLLNFSRTGAAQFRPVELNAVVRDALALVEHPLKSANIDVIAALHPAAIEVHGDAGKLQQVFLNLILNARDAMPRGGTLRLSSGFDGIAPGARAWIAVSDTGEGIPPELHHRIFDPFFTTKAAFRVAPAADASVRRSATMSTGTGLGLAVTYGIVQEHSGAIHVSSQPGKGAEFRVELPLLAPAISEREPALA
jgi:PAS domain S-box-containing protein